MKHSLLISLGLMATFCGYTVSASDIDKVKPTPNGITLPDGYKDWSVISSSHRTDIHSMRVIVGNDIAIKAARAGKTNPWPDGSILGKMVWKEIAEKHWPTAIAPSDFVHAEFMLKDSKKYSKNGTGWGWARWVGMEQKPFGEDENSQQICISCHLPVKSQDWVFTIPAELP